VYDNPFAAEEARLDPVFTRLMQKHATHPDFPKILGRVDKPSTAVVFGEKGTGKTALRMLISNEIAEHNQQNPKRRVLEVPYDDFNRLLDNLLEREQQDADRVLADFRLVDHQDAILSAAVTRLVDAMLNEQPRDDEEHPVPLPSNPTKALRALPRDKRVDLAVLAAIYDSPNAGSGVSRWRRLRRKLGLGWHLPLKTIRWLTVIFTVVAVGLAVAGWLVGPVNAEQIQTPLIVVAALAGLGWLVWAIQQLRLGRLARKVARETRSLSRDPSELRQIFGQLRMSDLNRQPLPSAKQAEQTKRDTRYQLTRQFLEFLGGLNFVGMMVMVDRVDEPTAISGDPEKMRRLLWPVFDNKFLQQDRVGLKLLLPIDLRHALYRESPQFFQEARLDKQNMIDRLEWSGATLYDLCSSRLRACRDTSGADGDAARELYLTDLFDEDVSEATLVDALDQMHQPRDAFKFLYRVIQEHCRLVPEDQANFKVAKLTLESVRRSESQRVQELYRGLTPS
jgi:hypothetical protein